MDDGADIEIPDDPRISDYAELIAAAEPVHFSVDDENQAAALCYTSGTTGDPKGVLYSHRSLYLHSLQVNNAESFALSPRDLALPVVPMFHVNAHKGMRWRRPRLNCENVERPADRRGAPI